MTQQSFFGLTGSSNLCRNNVYPPERWFPLCLSTLENWEFQWFPSTICLPLQVNLKHGLPSDGFLSTCAAGAGTLLLEFGVLGHLVDDPIFERRARRAVQAVWDLRSTKTGLIGELKLILGIFCVLVRWSRPLKKLDGFGENESVSTWTPGITRTFYLVNNVPMVLLRLCQISFSRRYGVELNFMHFQFLQSDAI